MRIYVGLKGLSHEQPLSNSLRMDQHPQEEGVPARTEEEPAIVWDFARPILVSRFFLGGVHSPACLRAAPTCFVKRLNFEGQIFVQRLYFEV